MSKVRIDLVTEDGQSVYNLTLPEDGSPIAVTFTEHENWPIRRLSAQITEQPSRWDMQKFYRLEAQMEAVQGIVCDHDDY